MKSSLLLICYTTALLASLTSACNRIPQGASGDNSPVNENYQVLIEGNPSTYIPGQQYNLSLSGNGLKFISFSLVVESELEISDGNELLGHFDLIDIAETRFSMTCENMIENTNTNKKSRIDVAWVAPTDAGSGCVLIKAAVLQHRNVWFIDDGFLSKRICPEEIDEINSQTPPLSTCCACDEAKYEIILERKWSKNTHAKDFPVAGWRTRLSEVIGASHSIDYRVWGYGSLASPGLKEMAEHGSTRTLEAEIKEHLNTGNIRTIIKAPGILYRQNVIGTTLANVRVDSTHHVISLISKIDPSPDWVLGVAGLELCLSNCTWIDRKVLNLFPWDIGTDAGPSYMSPDQPQVPPDVVRRITSTFPSDYRSPFYDETGTPMKPLATLYINKKKLYQRECSFENNEEAHALECATHPWNNWSECSTKCGPGIEYRMRVYKDPVVAANYRCNLPLRESQSCMGNQCGPEEFETIRSTVAECELTPWSNWSPCSKRCGNGNSSRTRDFVNPNVSERCQSDVPVVLEQSRDCYGDDCSGTISDTRSEYYSQNEFNTQFDNDQDAYEPRETNTKQSQRNRNNNNLEDSRMPQQNIYESEKFSGRPWGSRTPYDEENRNVNIMSGNINDYANNYQERVSNPNQSPDNYRGKLPESPTNPPNSYQNGWNTFDALDSNKYPVVQDYCFQKPVASPRTCNGTQVKVMNYWFYDAEDSMCKLFTSDNCDQNKNKFRTLETCESMCHSALNNVKPTGYWSAAPSLANTEDSGREHERAFNTNGRRRQHMFSLNNRH